MDDDKYLDGIKSTGYELELLISNYLTLDGWSVINNKYYIDDVQGTAREIDILAYKAKQSNGIQVYTVLIISCKKSLKNTWALLAKEKNLSDPNMDWKPITLWSNHEAIKLILNHNNWKESYTNSHSNLSKELFTPSKHIFAFQELNTSSGKSQNDKAIFNSIVSLMKSQGYEIDSLDKRKKDKSFYNFNLVSVVDAPIKRINYSRKPPKVETIDSDIYVGSYIINKKETASRIHIINKDSFCKQLKTYNLLHEHNINQCSVLLNSFFKNCLRDPKKVDLYLDHFNRDLGFSVYRAVKKLSSDQKEKVRKVSIMWDSDKEAVALQLEDIWDKPDIESLNNNADLTQRVKMSLKKVYKYEGKFFFNDDIPF